MFKKIVVGVDGSESAGRGLELAGELARTYGAGITLVHAYEAVPEWLGEPQRGTRIGQQIGRSEEILADAEQRLRDQGVSSIERDALEGPAATAIINAATARKADLIVLGSRGLTPIKGLLLGSVSERVTGVAPCPVLVAR